MVHCGDLYAIGGSGPSQGLEPLIRAVERYSWNEDCWRVVTQLTPPVHSVECAASLGEHIYTYCVSVGRDHENSYVATLRCFDSKNDAWEELPSSDDKVWERGIYKMVTVQDCIFIAKVGSQYIRAYNPNTRQWHNFELFPFDQNRFSTLLSVEDRVYFLATKTDMVQIVHAALLFQNLPQGNVFCCFPRLYLHFMVVWGVCQSHYAQQLPCLITTLSLLNRNNVVHDHPVLQWH